MAQFGQFDVTAPPSGPEWPSEWRLVARLPPVAAFGHRDPLRRTPIDPRAARPPNGVRGSPPTRIRLKVSEKEPLSFNRGHLAGEWKTRDMTAEFWAL